MYAGAVLIPLPVIGSLIGGMVGYMLSGKVFTALSSALSSAKLRPKGAHPHRKGMRGIHSSDTGVPAEPDEITKKYFKENRKAFDEALGNMVSGLKLGDADGYIHGANQITRRSREGFLQKYG